ncbi:MAG: cytochrome P450 [Rhodoglobus sp.]
MPDSSGQLDASVATKYHIVDDPRLVREVFNRADSFAASNALTAVTPLTAQSLRVLTEVGFALPPVLANNDGDSHRGIRRVVSSFFTPAIVAGIEPRIRELARVAVACASELLETQGSVDLAQTVTAEPPAILMLDMLGLPTTDLKLLKAWSRDSLELFWGWPDSERQCDLAHSAAEFYEWLCDLVLVSLSDGSDNLFRALSQHGLSQEEVCSIGYFLLIAAQETTSQLASTALIRVLDGTVGPSWGLTADRKVATAAIRYVLAHDSSGPTARRVARHDIEFDGALIPAGAEILLELTGHHGPGATESSYSIAFGSGMHRCIGARLAELEATVILQETATGLPQIGLINSVTPWRRLLSFRAPESVVVEQPQELQYSF